MVEPLEVVSGKRLSFFKNIQPDTNLALHMVYMIWIIRKQMVHSMNFIPRFILPVINLRKYRVSREQLSPRLRERRMALVVKNW